VANPFLVLGGIAIGIITAGFGVLAVPGWVASAQDAAAQNDLGNAVAAHSAAVSQTGKAATSLGALKSGHGLRFEESNGSSLETYANGANWGLVATSASGAVFGKVSGNGTVFRGNDRAALLNDAAFKSAWAGNNLPALSADGSAPPVEAFGQWRYASDGGYYTLLARNGTNVGTITISLFDDGEGGRWISVFGTVNGLELLPTELVATATDVQFLATTGAFGDAWVAAGLSAADLRNGFDGFTSAPTMEGDYLANPSDAMFQAMAAGYWMQAVGYHEMLPEDFQGYSRIAFGDGETRALVATAQNGFTVGVVSVDGVPGGAHTASSLDALKADPAFGAALSSAGFSF
jgi:hypothetical protein